MRGKTVVITGGTSGIGEVVAEALAQMGARIVLIARSWSRDAQSRQKAMRRLSRQLAVKREEFPHVRPKLK
jgi:NAD(P)-dependent dehydrogenase (short-subunit alcohol dehydrogenase family)